MSLYDILPTLKGGVSSKKEDDEQRSIHPRAEARGFLECCYKNEDLYNELKELGVIPSSQLDQASEDSEDQKIPLGQILVDRELISDENVGKVISDIISVPYINLSTVGIDEKVAKMLPEIYAKKQRLIAFKMDKAGLHVAMEHPLDKETIQFVEKKVGVKVIPYYSSKRDITNGLSLYAKDVEEVFDTIIKESLRRVKGSVIPEPSIVKIVDLIIQYAYQNSASDVHIEPLKQMSLVRFRIDGILHDIVKLPETLHSQIITRVKVLAKLRTDEHQSSQDGKISYSTQDEDLDIRVSIVPITNGEKVVMRLLSEKSRQFSLQDLGLVEDNLRVLEDAYKKPHGMILVTGPTGSGKTTTLYAILKILNERKVNIMTIEDPVEYGIEGVNQIQANPKTDLTFAKGLRAIVRQDPDIILVGEIRDQETADISVNAAMTGHLLLSTLHTNDAVTAFPRLLDLGVEPFLISSCVNIVIGQRLVRKICQKCRISVGVEEIIQGGELGENGLISGINDSILDKFKDTLKGHIYKGKGCDTCHYTGYLGRVGIFEVLSVDRKIREAIVDKKDAGILLEIAKKAGMKTMLDDGVDKVKSGVTTIQEIIRVTKE